MRIEEKNLLKIGFKLIPVSECNIKNIGETEETVYDMEVDDKTHTFFANDILVHNSIYVRMDNVLKILFGKMDINWDNPDVFHKVKKFVDTKFQDVLNNHVANFICDRFKTEERRIEFKREKISSEGDYLAKKRYAVHVRDNEGVECNKFSYTGVDIAKNELPEKIKELLRVLVENMMANHWTGNTEIQPELLNIYDTYSSLEFNDVAYIKNLNTPKKRIGNFMLEKGAGVHARAAEFYNELIDEMKLNDKYEKINTGDRFHYMYVKSNKYGIDCIAWKDRYPDEFKNIFEMDVNIMFDKTICSPLKKFMENHQASKFDPNNIMINGESGCNIFDL